jgi:putative SOS response-associated peptidase YedK
VDAIMRAMCGRFTQQRPTSELAEIFDAQPADEAVGAEKDAHYNVAPTEQVRVVVEPKVDAPRVVASYRWGLVPGWAKDARIGNRLINARADSLATSNAFRRSFEGRRCIVPADAFYEWLRQEGRPNLPFLVRRRDGEPMALAGLWATWHDDVNDAWLRSFTIVTTAANDLMARIHDRMPVVLEREDWARWLDPEVHDRRALQKLLRPAPEGILEAYEVSTEVSNPRNKGAEVIRPISAEVLR